MSTTEIRYHLRWVPLAELRVRLGSADGLGRRGCMKPSPVGGRSVGRDTGNLKSKHVEKLIEAGKPGKHYDGQGLRLEIKGRTMPLG